jgi:adenosylmethionine-8-amino-7-oxononanoate aminotransferase
MVDFVQMKGFQDEPLILEKGVGIRVTDVFGKTYIDGLSGVFTVNLGHGIAELADVAAEQARQIAFTAPTMATNPRALELSELLIGITPPQYTTVKFFSGGSEATEAAIKLARQYWQQAPRRRRNGKRSSSPSHPASSTSRRRPARAAPPAAAPRGAHSPASIWSRRRSSTNTRRRWLR